ncbi:MAG TPA: aminotransferase class I/II-fold pyridoxal phosphate-dependent enzyme [Pilimelia sp.]|nr:aminotransferase class I/II-fold pyridoxal phosphate-dependent enzyme [Pilimelia sp.]
MEGPEGRVEAQIVAAVRERTAAGVATGVARLVSAGILPPGTQLPTVRALARALRISPTTVSEAWQSLLRSGVIDTRGRRGTTVRGVPRPAAPARFSRLHRDLPARLDLSAGTPDPELLPDVGQALHRLSRSAAASSYFDVPVLPDLERVLRADWPFDPDAVTVVDGAVDAIDRLFGVLLRFGDRVLVENPTFPPILDLLEQAGMTAVGLAVDDEGVRPEALAEALADAPAAALVLQPRAHNPCGHSMSARRAGELAGVLAAHPAVRVIEDDHASAIATAPPVSLGRHLPDRTVHIRGFSKSHGPDLRLAALGGARDLVDRVVQRRLLGPAWSSRLLQAVLLDLLTDPASVAAVARAREVYADRRRRLTAALTRRGVAVTGADGINLWVAVPDESSALVTLAVHGVTAAPGSPFLSAPLPGDHVRVTCAAVRADFEWLADLIARSAAPHPRHAGTV